ncbi:MAG TPA: AarF/UbiB family protein [Candidatus Paceibacterota bacterium]|nr:AarF/UbiB family protein [Candidatus Paceibacterota bacterium]
MKEKFEVKIYQESLQSNEVGDIAKIVERFFTTEFEIGKGDFSKVYKNYFNKTCFKVFSSQFEQIRSADEEAHLLSLVAKLRSKNIANTPVPLYSIMPIDKSEKHPIIGRGFFVMQRIEGSTIKDIIDQKLDLPTSFKFEDFFAKIGKFLQAIHKEGIYHRDVHNGNIMIEANTADPFVIDFGNSVVFLEEEQKQIKEKILDPYKISVRDKSFQLQDDFTGLEKSKQELKSFLTGEK